MPAYVSIISWSDFIRYDPEGNVVLDSRELPKVPSLSSVLWSEPLLPQSLKNVGANDIHTISVEIKMLNY